MAVCLALVLLALALLVANAPLHHAWAHHDASGSSGCVVCLFAQGQVALTDLSPILEVAAFLLLVGLVWIHTSAPWDIDLFLPRGRAPPHLASIY